MYVFMNTYICIYIYIAASISTVAPTSKVYFTQSIAKSAPPHQTAHIYYSNFIHLLLECLLYKSNSKDNLMT